MSESKIEQNPLLYSIKKRINLHVQIGKLEAILVQLIGTIFYMDHVKIQTKQSDMDRTKINRMIKVFMKVNGRME